MNLSYRRDNARRWSLRRLTLYKVGDSHTNWKPVRDFMLMSYLAPLFSYRPVSVKLSPLTKVCISLTHSFAVVVHVIVRN